MIARKQNIVVVVGWKGIPHILKFRTAEAAKSWVSGSGLEYVKFATIANLVKNF